MIRGIDKKQEQSARQLARDTRPLGTRIAEFMGKPEMVIISCGVGAATMFAFPGVADFVAFWCVCNFIFAMTRKVTLPIKLPKSSHVKDYNDPKPGSNQPKLAEGITFFGNDRVSREELWFSDSDMRTHVLIFGSTGSGKTEMLISLAYNSLVQGSGFIYIDGKGDNSLYSKIFSMVRSVGREDDMLLINFMTGARDILGPQKTRLSNTMNPFARGSSSMLSQLVISLMPSSKQGSGGGNDDMWTGRAMNFVESLMRVLTVMRDAGYILLDANTIRDFFILEKLETIVIDKKFPIDENNSVSLEAFPKEILEPLNAYMNNLPGFNRQKKHNQSSEVREQHGFITMQLTRVFGSLADTYGHIIRTNLAEVDFKDVVLNRRIMVVLLPALEKSPQELSNLGKIIVASLKAMMAAGLGEEVEGDYRDVVLRKPTNCASPYVCVMDEYGYYAVEGFAVVPAQARSLGFSAIFAGQDLPAFQKASKEEAASIGANCNIKICMKLEDPQETWEYFNKVAGESYVTNVSGFQMDNASLTLNYMDTRSASVDKRQRIDLLDLKDQRPGEYHLFFKSNIIRADVFYAAPKPIKKLRLNQFLKVEPPTEIKLADMEKRLKQFTKVFQKTELDIPEIHPSEDIDIITRSLEQSAHLRPFERGVAALIALLEKEVSKQKEISAPYEESEPAHEMSAFTKIPVTPMVLRTIGNENKDLFSLPLIRRGSTLEELKHIERLIGKSEPEALKTATSLITDIEKATQFPPEVEFERNMDALLQDISDMLNLWGGGTIDIEALKQQVESGDVPEAGVGEHGLGELPDFPELEDINFDESTEEEEGEEGDEEGEGVATIESEDDEEEKDSEDDDNEKDEENDEEK